MPSSEAYEGGGQAIGPLPGAPLEQAAERARPPTRKILDRRDPRIATNASDWRNSVPIWRARARGREGAAGGDRQMTAKV